VKCREILEVDYLEQMGDPAAAWQADARLPRIRSEIGLRCRPAKPHEPYDNEVGKRWTEIAKATDNFKGLRSANFADRWA
jgi:hypothetical protein